MKRERFTIDRSRIITLFVTMNVLTMIISRTLHPPLVPVI